MTREEYEELRAKKKKKGFLSRIFGAKKKTESAAPAYQPQQTQTYQVTPPPAQALSDDDGVKPSDDSGAALQQPGQDTDDTVVNSELDRTDEQLMIGLGMENELKQQVGEEKAKEIDAQLEENARLSEEAVAISDDTRSRFEFVSPEQSKSVFAYYRACYRGLIWRLGVCVLLFIGVFIHENINLFGCWSGCSFLFSPQRLSGSRF